MDNPAVGFLHRLMVIPAIKMLGTDDQISEWLPGFLSYKYIGSYTQTELGHGSDVQGLQTTAIYNKE
jgi:acyl-CoA oxidase